MIISFVWCFFNKSITYFISSRYSEQKSPGIHMTGANQYYIEGVFRQFSNYNHFHVAMKIPGVDDQWIPLTYKYMRRV